MQKCRVGETATLGDFRKQGFAGKPVEDREPHSGRPAHHRRGGGEQLVQP